jgi:putative PEP-CTERM system TPR-repeat lipoprotein
VILVKSFAAVCVAAAFLGVGCSKSVPESMQQGKDFLARGELSSSVIAFKNAVQANESSPDARVALGEALERTGDETGTEQQYRKALELGGNADDLVPRVAILLIDRSDMATIVRDFGDKQLTQPASDSELRGIVALAQSSLGHKDAAEAQLARAKTNVPAVRLARAQLAMQAKRPQDAQAELESVLKEGQAPWWVLRAASRVYAARGDQTNALAAMKGAYELAGWHRGVIGEYAEQLFQAGRSADAKPLRDKLRRIAPRYYRTAFIEALFQMEEGKFDEAHDSAVKALAALSEHVPSLLIAAKVELDRGELASAETRIKKVLATNPTSIQALHMQFMLELRRGDTKAAAAVLERAQRVAPNDRGLLAAAADLAWAKGDKAGAAKQLATAAQMKPPQPELLTRLAEMDLALGKRVDASAAIDQAINLTKDDARLRERVFRSVLRLRLLDKARQMAQAELERRPKEPEPYLWMAGVVGSEGNEAAALEQTGHALDLRPDYYPALLVLGRTATKPERAKEYDARLQKAVDAGSKDVRIYLDRARRLRLTGADADQVGAVLARGVTADPGSVGMREAVVNHWLAWGRKDKALEVAAEGETAHPDDMAMKALAASTLEVAGNLEQAATKYAELQARAPDRIGWGLKHAQALGRAGKASDAMLSLRKLISLRADEPAPYQMLAMLQVEQKQTSDALVTADMLAERPKFKAAGLLLRGDIYARTQDKGEALKAYGEAGKAGAAEEALSRRVELNDRTGGEVFATSELRDWLAAHPDSIPALSVAARRESAKQDYAAAARYLETIAKLNPNNPVALNDLAWAYAQARNPAALVTAKKAAALAPENPQILDTVAVALVLAGQKKEAIANLRQAMSLAPRNPTVRVHLAELLVDEGNKKDAVALLEGLDPNSLDKEAARRFQGVKGRL